MGNARSDINFFYDSVDFTFRNRTKLKSFIKTMIRKENKKLSYISYIFCTDKSLLYLNRKFLNHNYRTDILTFPLSNNSSIQAEIYISIDRVKENARIFNISFNKELIRVIFHGVLHLTGYKDKTLREKKEMRAKEDEYLQLYQSFT